MNVFEDRFLVSVVFGHNAEQTSNLKNLASASNLIGQKGTHGMFSFCQNVQTETNSVTSAHLKISKSIFYFKMFGYNDLIKI